MSTFFGGQGVLPTLGGVPDNQIQLAAGQVWLVPAGWWEVQLGLYTTLQEYDAIQTCWRTVGAGSIDGFLKRFRSDGVNYRVANQTGCAVGAVVTTAGSSITAPPVVTPSAGGSKWQAVIGGAINTSVTVTNAGTNYTYPPLVVFSPPPSPGVPATGYAVLSGATVGSITVTDQGAGYTAAPTVTFINDPREGLNGTTIGTGAAAVAALTGSQTLTALLCLDHGTPLTAVPTFTFSPSGPAATAVMDWTITAYVVSATTAGSGYTTPVIVSAYETPIGGSVLTNPRVQNQLVRRRDAKIIAALSAGAFTATGQTIQDGGVYDQVPTVYVQSQGVFGANPVQAVFLSPTMGGVSDTFSIYPG